MKLTIPISTAAAVLAASSTVALASPANMPGMTDCNPNSAGCSACTQCLILQLNTAGCGQSSAQDVIIHESTGCINLIVGMDNTWISESTGFFDSCILYTDRDCNGDGSTWIQNTPNVCTHTNYWVKSIECFGGGPDKNSNEG